MAKKDLTHLFDDLIATVKSQVAVKTDYIPDIITFCESPHYLNICNNPGNPIQLYPLQRIAVKCLYRGSVGNESLELTEEEIKLLQDKGMEYIIDKFNSGDLFRELVLVWGRRCLGEDSLIFNPDTGSYSSIGKMWDEGSRKTSVCSLGENTYKFKKTSAEIIYNGIKPTYRMKLKDGRYIDATDNHPFLTISGWKQLKDLSIKDRIAVPRSLPFFGKEQTCSNEVFRLVGYMTGDGCCSQSGSLDFSCANECILNDFSKCVEQLSDKLCVTHKQRYNYKITKKTGRYGPKRNSLVDLLREVGLEGHTAHTKMVPELVFVSSKEQTKNYLQALFSCDGSLWFHWNARDEKFNPRVSYTTVSEELAYGVHSLLVKFGIFSKLRKRKIKSNFNTCGHSYQIDICDYGNVRKYIEKIGFIGKEKKEKKALELIENIKVSNNYIDSIPKEVWEYVDFEKDRLKIATDKELMSMPVGERNARCRREYSPSRQKVKTINKKLNSDHLNKITQDNIIWMPIKSISRLGKQRTFDLSVNENDCHNFIANNIVSHNSGKDLVTSLIACYEAMRLLEIPGGNPFAYYNIKAGNPIYILTVASSDRQAKILFNEIKTVILNSPYFQDKIGDNGKAIDGSSIRLLTPSDKDQNIARAEKGMELERGNVVILAGHSNSDSLRGNRTACLLLDEVATYKTTSGSGGGESIISALAPSTNDFRVYYEEDGETKSRLDSKIILISSPRGKEGLFWRMWHQSFDVEMGKQRMMMKAPTWEVNLQHTKEAIRRDFANMTEQEFNMEFGAEFAGLEGERFLSDECVEKAICNDLGQNETGQRGVFYYAHLDPAASSHNYALAIVHIENYIRQIPIGETGQIRREHRRRFLVDHLKIWTPSGNRGIDFEAVDNYVVRLSKLFRFAMVSYDCYEYGHSIQKLRKHGIPTRVTAFRKRYKEDIYRNLEQLFITGEIALPGMGPHAKLLELELKNLKRKWTLSGGFSIGPNEEGEVKTDDLVDALAGACGVAMKQMVSGLPKAEMAYMPIVRDQQNWKIGSGTYTQGQFNHWNQKFGIGGS